MQRRRALRFASVDELAGALHACLVQRGQVLAFMEEGGLGC